MGHSHPDAGSFILYGGGSYLTGPMGYAGIPSSKLSNTLLIDGKGQANEGGGHDAFRDYPYARLDSIRITSAVLERNRAEIVAELAGAYRPELGVDKLERRFSFTRRTWVVTDTLRASRPVVMTAQVHGDRPSSSRGTPLPGRRQAGGLEGRRWQDGGGQGVIGPGIVVAAGPPGHVDQGPTEERGTVLRLSLPASRDGDAGHDDELLGRRAWTFPMW
jgi:hypothetical protein